MRAASEVGGARVASGVPSAHAGTGSVFDTLARRAPRVVHRLPPREDPSRWRVADVGGRAYRFAQPLTFTPYASARPCSARCRFCSENLQPARGGAMSARMRPASTHLGDLRRALAAVRDVPMSWSLSGLETTDDPDGMLALLDVLTDAEASGARIQHRVLYSNAAGLAGAQSGALLDALERFGLSWLELSRHHLDAGRNQAIMRFRPGQAIADGDVFARTVRCIAARLPLKLVCIVQAGGVDTAEGVAAYIEGAARLGATAVIFRELSRLDDAYRDNGTRRYIDAARIDIERLLEQCLDAGWWRTSTLLHVTDGYYFRNVVLRTAAGMEVTFEVADYAAMHRRHDSGDVYKLVFHPNGNLCAGWEPERDVLLAAPHG